MCYYYYFYGFEQICVKCRHFINTSINNKHFVGHNCKVIFVKTALTIIDIEWTIKSFQHTSQKQIERLNAKKEKTIPFAEMEKFPPNYCLFFSSFSSSISKQRLKKVKMPLIEADVKFQMNMNNTIGGSLLNYL